MSDPMRLLLVVMLIGAMLMLVAAKPDKDDGKNGKGNGPPPHAVANGLQTPAPEPTVPPPDVIIVEPPPIGHFDPPLPGSPVLVLPDTAARDA